MNTSNKTIIDKDLVLRSLLIIIIIPLITSWLIYGVDLFIKRSEENNEKNLHKIADFKYDINRLTEASMILEIQRVSNYYKCNPYGTIGESIDKKSLNKNVILSLNNTVGYSLTDHEINEFKIKKLNPKDINRAMKESQFESLLTDDNISNYAAITNGILKGYIIYLGEIKFEDDINKYYGLEINLKK